MSYTLTTSAAILARAGDPTYSTNWNSTSSGGLMIEFADQAEQIVCAWSRYDWIDNWASLDTNLRYIVRAAVTARAAQFVVAYNMGKYGSSREAETILDVLENDFSRNMKKLEESEYRKPIGAV